MRVACAGTLRLPRYLGTYLPNNPSQVPRAFLDGRLAAEPSKLRPRFSRIQMTTAIREDVEVDRHAGESAPTQPIPRPQLGASFKVDDAVIEGPSPFACRHQQYISGVFFLALPVSGSTLASAISYGMSLWGETAQLMVELPDKSKDVYFLKCSCPQNPAASALDAAHLARQSQTVKLGDTGRTMIQGEFQSLKAIHGVSPSFAPHCHAWGK